MKAKTTHTFTTGLIYYPDMRCPLKRNLSELKFQAPLILVITGNGSVLSFSNGLTRVKMDTSNYTSMQLLLSTLLWLI